MEEGAVLGVRSVGVFSIAMSAREDVFVFSERSTMIYYLTDRIESSSLLLAVKVDVGQNSDTLLPFQR